jgi:hypothetical protein
MVPKIIAVIALIIFTLIINWTAPNKDRLMEKRPALPFKSTGQDNFYTKNSSKSPNDTRSEWWINDEIENTMGNLHATLSENRSVGDIENETIAPVSEKISRQTSSVLADPIRLFGNTLGTTLRDHIRRVGNEVSLFLSLIKSPNEKAFNDLLRLSAEYRITATAIRAIETPEGARDLTETLVENYSLQSEAIKTLADKKSLGTISDTALYTYNQSVKGTANTLIQIDRLFKNRQVTFGVSEPGSIFNLPE